MGNRDPSLLTALERSGGVRVLADQLGIRASGIYQWRRVPALRVRDVARVSGVPPHTLRPDLYDVPAEDDCHAVASGA